MKKFISTSLFLFCVIIMVSQVITNDDYVAPKSKWIAADRVSASISAGAGVSFLNNSNSTAFTTYIAPEINYQLSSKFKLTIGMIHYSLSGNSWMPLNNSERVMNNGNGIVKGNLISIGGEYQVNKKIILSGAMMVDANDFSKNQVHYKAASIGLEYKMNEHSSFKIETRISQNVGNYYNSNAAFDQTNPYYYGYGNNDMFRSITTGGVGTLMTQSLNSAIK